MIFIAILVQNLIKFYMHKLYRHIDYQIEIFIIVILDNLTVKIDYKINKSFSDYFTYFRFHQPSDKLYGKMVENRLVTSNQSNKNF